MRLPRFLTDETGGYSIVFAVAAPLLLLSTGVAIDYTNAVSTNSKMQDALDGAVIAAVLTTDLSQKSARLTDNDRITLKNTYAAQLDYGDIKNVNKTMLSDTVEVSAEASFNMKSNFGFITGKKYIPIKVSAAAKAPIKVSSMRLQLQNASGWWGKTVSFRGSLGGVDTEIANAVYDSSGPWGPTSFTASDTDWIDVSSFEDIYIQFSIHDDAFEFNKWCELPGCPSKVFSTKSTLNSDRFYINGKKQPKNTTIKFGDSIQCGVRVDHAWEDGGAETPDFYYRVEGRCDRVNPADIFLSQ